MNGAGDVTRYCWRCAASLDERPPTRCASCGQEHFNNPKPAAMAVVERDGDVLLVRRAADPWRGRWDVPGGFCDAGEHPSATAEREVLEETGWRVRTVGLLGIWPDDYGAAQPDGLQETTVNIAYLARPADAHASASPDDEVAEVAWFGADELPLDLAFPGHIPAVLEAARRMLARSGGDSART